MLFDSHAHYHDEQFNHDRYDAIKRAHDEGVEYLLAVSTDIASSVENIAFTQQFDYVYAAVGIHPHNVADANNNIISALADFSTYPKVVAIGEIGLDYYYDNAPREAQKIWFSKQINLARNLKMPIIVHDRDAHEDTMNIIAGEMAREVGGVFHCFSGSVEMAKEVLNNNFYISVGGPATFKNARKIIEVIKYVPMDRLLIETDCPYLTPEPYRGRRNESGYVRLVAEKVAEIRGMTLAEVAENTARNARRLFNIQ